MDRKIMKQLKTDYEDLELKPSANLWDQIENGLDGAEETVQKTHFKWLKYAAVVVLLISLGSVFYIKTENPVNEKNNMVRNNSSEKKLKTTENSEAKIPDKEKVENAVVKNLEIDSKVSSEKVYKKQTESTQPAEIVSFKRKNQDLLVQTPNLSNPETTDVKTSISHIKKSYYINAEELLLGRELDKTRVEIKNRQFGVLDASKLKFKRPGSLQIFGVQVFADSIVSE